MTDEQVIRIAREHHRNPYSEAWWQGANLEPGRGEYKYGVRESGVIGFKRGKRAAAPRGKKRPAQPTAAERAYAARAGSGRAAADLPF